MLTQGEDVEADALAKRGWSIPAIARHLERDRKTVRAYLRGARTPGVRVSAAPDPLAPFTGYLAARFVDDQHLLLAALFDEVVTLTLRARDRAWCRPGGGLRGSRARALNTGSRR